MIDYTLDDTLDDTLHYYKHLKKLLTKLIVKYIGQGTYMILKFSFYITISNCDSKVTHDK